MGVHEIETDIKRVISPVEIMQFMTHNSLNLYKKKGFRVPFERVVAYEKSNKNIKVQFLCRLLKLTLLKVRDIS